MFQGYNFVVIAALCKFQKATHAMAETGQSWWVASSILCTSSLQFFGGCCVARSRCTMWSAPWWDEASPDMCLKSQGLGRLSDMCQKSPGLEGCQLRLKPQRLLGCQLCLELQALLGWQICTKGSHLLLGCQMYATEGEIWALKYATHYELLKHWQGLFQLLGWNYIWYNTMNSFKVDIL